MKTKLHICYKYIVDLGLAPACSLVGGLVSVSPYGPRLVDCVGFSWCSGPLWPTQSYPPVFHRTLKLPLMFGYLCVHFHPLLDEDSQETVMLGSCLEA